MPTAITHVVESRLKPGGGFTDRTLADLRADPPRQALFDSHDATPWPAAP